jgi:hypothetical protein
MSDTCFNCLEVTGHADLIKGFKAAAQGRFSKDDGTLVTIPLSFDALVPQPAELRLPPAGWDRPYSDLMNPSMDLFDADDPRGAVAERLAAARARLEAGEALAPVERAVLEREAAWGVAHWYPWRLLFWGVKSDLDDETGLSCPDPNTLVYRFDTPWSPPEAWLGAVARRFPGLRFVLVFADTNDAFGGYRVLEGGVAVATHDVEPALPDEDDEGADGFEDDAPPLFDRIADAAPWARGR